MLSTSTVLSLLSLPLLASAASVVSTGTTFSISPASYPDLCVVPASDSEGARLQLADCDTSSDIAWTFDGKALHNSATDKCADIADGGAWSGNHVQVWGCYSWNSNQQFASDDGLIQWSGTNFCLDLTDGKGVEGNHVQIWTCFDGNSNQQWSLNEVEEVDDDDCDADDSSTDTGSDDADCEDEDDSDDDDTVSSAASSSAAITASASASASEIDASITASITAPVTASITASASASDSALGGELWAGGSSKHHHKSSSASDNWGASSTTDSWDASTTDSWAASKTSDAWGSASSTDSWGSNSTSTDAWGSASTSDAWDSASASATSSGYASKTSSAANSTATVGSGSSNSSDMSGYLQVSGTKVVDASGNTVFIKGTNLGGWLVWEDWMCGITDNSGNADRFPQTTLESRFGETQTRELMQVWQDNWLVSSDFDTIAEMGFNVVRLPFSYKNFVNSDGSYITDSSGNLDLSRLDWAVAQAKQRGIYIIPTYHIWDGQEAAYSTISEDSTEGQAQRDKAGELWTKIASHFAGEAAIAAFDAINEPTGSANNNLQRDLYNAIRKGDSKRIIVMESISAAPDSDWTNVVYSMHEYLMMGEDNESYNQQMFESGVVSDTNTYTGVGVPTYIGEFMASGDTLTWMLNQMANMDIFGYSGWTYVTTNMDRWGLYNFPSSMSVDVSSDSYDTIKSAWSNMGTKSKSRVADIYAAAAGGSAPSKRDEIPAERSEPERTMVYSPRVAEPRKTKRFSPHGGRSRRTLAHGKGSSF